MENLQSKTPYNFKKSYGGTPEPLPPEYPPCRRGPSLKKKLLLRLCVHVTASEQNIPVTSLDIFCPVSTLDRPVCSLDKNMSSDVTGINAGAQ